MDSKWKQRSLGLSIVLLIFCVLMIWLAIGLEMDRSESIKLFDPQEMDFNGLLPHIKTEYPDYVFKYVVHGGNLPECPIYFVLASKEEEGLTTWPTKTGRVVLLIDNDKCKKLDAMLRSARFFSWRSMWDDAAAHGLNWEITAKTPSGMNRVIVRPDARLSKEVNYLFTRNLRANRDEEDSELRYFQHIFQFKKPSSRPSLAVTRRDSEATGLVKSFFAMLQRVESLAAR